MAMAFLTGASGYVGRHVALEFLFRGHQVLGLARSPASAARLAEIGVVPVLGDLESPASFIGEAATADFIIHAGFSYSNDGVERPNVDITATEALLEAARSGSRRRHLIYTSSLFRYAPCRGEYISEEDCSPRSKSDWRHELSQRVIAGASDNLTTSVVRLGWIYGSEGGTLIQALSGLVGHRSDRSHDANRIPFCDVGQAAILYATAASRGWQGVLHACQGEPCSIRDLKRFARMPQRNDGGAASDELAGIVALDTPAVTLNPLGLEGLWTSGIQNYLLGGYDR